MFLRFGFAVGNVGFAGTVAIILIGHAVTIPTAMAIAEIATNQKVEGGGEYYIISRSFGLVIGSTIGITLYLSQAISVAFYIMAFAEAFSSLFDYLISRLALPDWIVWLLEQKQTVSIPALFILMAIVLLKGADLGVKALYVVVVTLGLSLLAFFMGETSYSLAHDFDPFVTIADQVDDGFITEKSDSVYPNSPILEESNNELPEDNRNGDSPILPLGFFAVFAIIFPAFTGMTAGVGLSGDLKDPGKSIPNGTLTATFAGMIIYLFIAYKLSISATPADLANTDSLVMAKIAWQGWWIIPVGLAAATLSSALGSILVAPRTLQAIARDRVMPSNFINSWLSKGKGPQDEPYNASVITIIIGLAFIMMGALDAVAAIISMFFMVTYGSLCLISFLQHFAADPAYRPRFRSRWYISLFGAFACFGLMFFMNSFYAIIAVVLVTGLYFSLASFNPDKRSMAVIFQGAIFQFSRQMQVFLQSAEKEKSKSWRPSTIALSDTTFQRLGIFDLLRWISQKYGFGTYIHQIQGYLSRQTNNEAREIKNRLIKLAEASESKIVVDTLVSPSYTSSIAQVIQLPGIAGIENNLLLLEFSRNHPDNLNNIVENFKLIRSVQFDIAILGSCERGFGIKKEIHVWISGKDYQNANLMILLAYILLGHKEWEKGAIKIFALYPENEIEVEKQKFLQLIQDGQLPISVQNMEFIVKSMDQQPRTVIEARSSDADLTILGFREETVKKYGKEVFEQYDNIGNILFVHAADKKEIK